MVIFLGICLSLEKATTWELTDVLRALFGVNPCVFPLPSSGPLWLPSKKQRAKPASFPLLFSPQLLGILQAEGGNLSATPFRVLTDPHPLLVFGSRNFFIQTLWAPYRILEFTARFGDWFHHKENLKSENPLNPSEKVAIHSAWLLPAPGNFLPPKEPASFSLLSLLSHFFSFFLSFFSLFF